MDKDFDLKTLATDNSPIYMIARVTEAGDAETVIHATDETPDASCKLIILYAMLAKNLEEKTGYGVGAINDVVKKYLDDNHPGHDKGCINSIETK